MKIKDIENKGIREYFEGFKGNNIFREEDVYQYLFEMLITLQVAGIHTNSGGWWVHDNYRPTKQDYLWALEHAKTTVPMSLEGKHQTCFHNLEMLGMTYKKVNEALLEEYVALEVLDEAEHICDR